MNFGTTASSSIVSRLLAAAAALAVACALAAGLAIGEAQAQNAPGASATAPAPTSAFASMLQGLVGLIVVVGLIYAVAWFVKRVGPRTRASGIVQVLGGASVGPREKVVVVRFGGETLLLGVAPGQVSLLHTSVDGGPIDTVEKTDTPPRFVDRLRAARSGA